MDQDIVSIKNKLIKVINKYKVYENLVEDKPVKNTNYWSPRFGFIRVSENTIAYDYSFRRKLLIGVEIGTNFANGNIDIINSVKTEVINIINSLVVKNGGFVYNKYGSAYYQVGYYI